MFLGAGQRVHPLEQGYRLMWQGNQMLLTFLHALGRDAPDSGLKIELGPFGFDYLGRPGEGQHQN